MNCPRCKTENVQGSSFCSSCGTSLLEVGVPLVPSEYLAGRGSRLVAKIIDLFFWLVPFALLYLLGRVLGEDALVQVLFIIAAWIYGIAIFIVQAVLLSKLGQTIGKKVLNIRVVMVNTGYNGGFVPNVLLRLVVNQLIAGFVPPYHLVDPLFIFRRDRRCIHDLIAGTRVVNTQIQ